MCRARRLQRSFGLARNLICVVHGGQTETSLSAASPSGGLSLADNLHDHALLALTVKFGIEDSLPSSEIELALRNRQSHRLMQQQTLEVRVAVVLAGFVMAVVFAKRGELFQPFVDILNEARLVVVDINGGRDVHRRHECQAFLHATFLNSRLDLRRDVNVITMFFCVELQIFGMRLHQQSIAVIGLGLCLTFLLPSFRLNTCPPVRSLSER
jgi:hypothetical protein